jgi:L-iditol 2-dehydrogenase
MRENSNKRQKGKTMKAIAKTKIGPGNVSMIDTTEPNPGQGEVKIKVHAVGICGTDIKILHGDTWSNPPVVLGHEFSGTVHSVGPGVTNVKIGDRVVAETAQVICGNCYYCKTGNALMCEKRLSIGYGTNGAMAPFCVVREAIIHPLPDSLGLDEAAVCEPLAVAVHAVYDTVNLRPTDTVVVMGPGPIGLLVASVVMSFGCRTILVGTDKDSVRLVAGKKLGVDRVVDVSIGSLLKEVNSITDNMGADVVFDCTGIPAAIRSGMSSLKKMGKFVQVGLTQQMMEIEYALLTQRQISISGVFGHNWQSWDTAIKLLQSGKVDVSAIITHHFQLEEWEQAFALAESQEGIKVMLHP